MVVNNDEDFEERYPPPLVLGMFIITTESVESISFLSTEEKSELWCNEEKLHWREKNDFTFWEYEQSKHDKREELKYAYSYRTSTT